MHKDTRNAKKPAQEENTRSKKRAGAAPAEKAAQRGGRRRDRKSSRAIKKMGHTLRAGSASTIKYTKKAMGVFNAFTHSDESAIHVDQIKQTPIRRLISFLSSLTFPAFILGSFLILMIALLALGNSTVSVDAVTVSIAGLPSDLEGYKIMLISDLHGREYGAHQASLLRVINGESYNLLLFAGDMVGSSGNAQPFYDLLDGLSASRQRFFISGDSDPSPLLDDVRDISAPVGEMVLNDWVLGAEERGATYLAHTTAIEVGSSKLWLSPVNLLNINLTETLLSLKEQVEQETEGVIVGIEGDVNSLPLSTYRYNQILLTQQAAGEMSASDVHLALSHIPPSEDFILTAQALSQDGSTAYMPMVDLILAGHYCGGGWQLPFFGAFYVPNTFLPRHGWFPAQSDVSGLKYTGTAMLYTTAGLSVSDRIYLPKFRLFNSPQVSLITLTAAVTDNLLAE